MKHTEPEPRPHTAAGAATENNFNICIAHEGHLKWAEEICAEMHDSAIKRGTGISKRSPEYLRQKMMAGEAVIAFTNDGSWAGFSYISAWDNGKFVSNSGLIVAPAYRQSGVAGQIKRKIFSLSSARYPDAKIFSLTSGLAVMKMNSALGFEPVTYSELPADPSFWEGCKSCVNYNILMSKGKQNCLCTAMLYARTKTAHKKSPACPGRSSTYGGAA
ncbi:GNAT family N-acetyltransferase [Chitinophagaceae bacterium MMS25-I14]